MRAASAIAMAAGNGVALGLIFTSTGLRVSGTVGGLYAIAVLVMACVYVGWLASQLSAAPASLVSGPLLVLCMLAALLALKALRLPSAPLVGDAIEVFVAPYAAAGAFGAFLGLAPWLRVPASAAERTGLSLTIVALAVGAVTYVLDMASGT
jgi:hypothetical protein